MSLLNPSPMVLQSVFILLVIVLVLHSEATHVLRLKRFTSEAGRLATYKKAIAHLWGYGLLAVFIALPFDLWSVDRTDLDWLINNPASTTAAIAVLGVYFLLAFFPVIHCAMLPQARQKYAHATRALHFLLPVSKRERRWWVLLSITAGICEEVVFRGFLPQFLQGQLHGAWRMDATVAWLLSALIFGFGHLYQGIPGMLRTATAGLMFGLAAILSGNLLLPIFLHAMVDVALLGFYYPQLDNPEDAVRLVQGCNPAFQDKP